MVLDAVPYPERRLHRPTDDRPVAHASPDTAYNPAVADTLSLKVLQLINAHRY